jgi:undecaprenyl-diphosphatase
LSFPDLIILTLVEGVADVLPIDPAAHALLLSRLTGWQAGAGGPAVHLGAALALLVFLWRDVALIGQGLWRLKRLRVDGGARLLAKLLFAALPWLAAAVLLGGVPVASLGDLPQVGLLTLVAALLMGLVDRMCMTVNRIEHLSGLSAALIGVVQALALIPGTGRVGLAITVARLLGLERPAAYRFVLLSNVPLMAWSGLHAVGGLVTAGRLPANSDLLAAGVSFLAVLAAVSLAMAWIEKAGLLPFVVYRLLLGGGLVALAFV